MGSVRARGVSLLLPLLVCWAACGCAASSQSEQSSNSEKLYACGFLRTWWHCLNYKPTYFAVGIHSHLKGAAQRPGLNRTLDSALRAASQGRTGRPVIISLVDGLMSRLHLPIFLLSLQEAQVADQFVVFALDDAAFNVCHQIHKPKLCTREFGNQSVNGTDIPVLRDERGGFEDWLLKGWMKTSITLKALQLGYNCLFMDIDMVALKNPFEAISPDTDVATTVDCQEEYHPRTSRLEGGPNLGTTFFRSTPTVISLVRNWLEKRSPSKWDQTEFKFVLEEAADAYPDMKLQMLRKAQFPVLCCGYCNDLVKPLLSREIGWREWCPASIRSKWVVFHAACMNHGQMVEGKDYDEGVQKQSILLMIWDLVKPDLSAPTITVAMQHALQKTAHKITEAPSDFAGNTVRSEQRAM